MSDLSRAAQATHSLTFPREGVTAVCAFRGRTLSAFTSGALRLHAAHSGAQLLSLRLPRAAPAASAALVPTADAGGAGDAVVLGAAYNTIHGFSMRYGNALGSFEAHADTVVAMAWAGLSAAERVLYTASNDTTVKAWPMAPHRLPWRAGGPPLFELSMPDASVPLCVQVWLLRLLELPSRAPLMFGEHS